jgi:hypothetical protein
MHTNLKPFKPGQSGNPSGKPQSRHVRKAIRKFMLEAQELRLNDQVYQGTRFEHLLRTFYDRALELIPKAPDPQSLMALLPLFAFIGDVVDGKESPATAAVRETREEHTVFVSRPPDARN